MPRPSNAILVVIVAGFCVAWAGIADAQSDPGFKVGDRVEIERFGEWKAGKVIDVNPRLKRIEVLLDEANVPPAVAPDCRKKYFSAGDRQALGSRTRAMWPAARKCPRQRNLADGPARMASSASERSSAD